MRDEAHYALGLVLGSGGESLFGLAYPASHNTTQCRTDHGNAQQAKKQLTMTTIVTEKFSTGLEVLKRDSRKFRAIN